MKKSFILEVLANARALDNSLDGDSVSVRVLLDQSNVIHSQALDPIVALLLNAAGEGHIESIKNPKSKIIYLNDLNELDLCNKCFRTPCDLIDCVSDWELLGSLKSYYTLNKLANLESLELEEFFTDFNNTKFEALVSNFITIYSLYAECEIDYNYQVSDGRDIYSVLNDLEVKALLNLESYHKSHFKNPTVTKYLENNRSSQDLALVSVMVGPLSQDSFWGEKPKTDNHSWQEKDFAKSLLVAYCYQALFSKTPCCIPYWVYSKIHSAFPEIISSDAHVIKTIKEHETAKKLYEEITGDGLSTYDECFKCAQLLEISPTKR